MPYLKNVHWVDSGRRLRDRFLEHLTDLPTGRHFTSPGHSVGDMLVSVIRSCLRSLTERRRIEARMIISLWGAGDRPSSESARLPPMWPGFKSRHRAICGLSLLLVLSLAPRGFSPGTPPGFPLCGCATSKSLFIYFFRHRTLQSAGLNAEFNFIFSKSAGACNVSFCFDFYLNVILRVLFSVALNH